MSLHYLLDGYNIIKRAPRLDQGALRDSRTLLFQWIDRERPQGSDKNRVTVVFDGKSEHYSMEWGGLTARAIFAQDESADDCIKRMLDDAGDVKSFVVVSDDKEIFLYARALGARVMSVREFAPGLFSRRASTPGATPANGDGKHVTLSQEKIINDELEKIWLKKRDAH